MAWDSFFGSNVVCVALIGTGVSSAAPAHSLRYVNDTSPSSVEANNGTLLEHGIEGGSHAVNSGTTCSP